MLPQDKFKGLIRVLSAADMTGRLWRGNSVGICSVTCSLRLRLHVRLLLKIPRLTDSQAFCKFPSFSLGYDISLQRLNSHVHSLIVQRRMTLRMGIKEEEITFIKKFRFPPSFWSCARRTFMLMKCINKVLKLSRSSLAHVSELENFQTRQLQSQWVPLKRDDLRDGLPPVQTSCSSTFEPLLVKCTSSHFLQGMWRKSVSVI